MIIGIASDHRGYLKKEKLKKLLKNYNIIDFGTDSENSVDYPLYAFKVGEAIKENKIDFGILLCGSGIGMSIAANKVKKVRCAKVDNEKEAIISRIDNNSNVIAISCDKNIEEIELLIKKFITQSFTNEKRHQRRINLIDNYES